MMIGKGLIPLRNSKVFSSEIGKIAFFKAYEHIVMMVWLNYK